MFSGYNHSYYFMWYLTEYIITYNNIYFAFKIQQQTSILLIHNPHISTTENTNDHLL